MISLQTNDLDKKEDQLCTCDHRSVLHGTDLCNWGEGTSTGCSCTGFQRAHLGRRPNCWCSIELISDENTKAHENEVSLPDMVPKYVQDALDQVRADLTILNWDLNNGWADKSDLYTRIENWRFNTWRHMEEILQAGTR